MRANRCARMWPGLLLGLTLTALALTLTVLTLTVLGALSPAGPASAPAPAPAPAPLSLTLTLASSATLSSGSGPAPPAPEPAPPPDSAPPDSAPPDSAPPDSAPPVAGPSVPAVARTWPVGVRPSVVRGWEPPATAYSRGHRGVDLAAAPGTAVRAVAAGRVSFAGRVAGRGIVSVELAGTGTPPLRTTYGPVRASVSKGDEVAAGAVVGTVEEEAGDAHCGPAPCLHWGLLRGGTYLDPLSLLPPWLLGFGPSRLLPLAGLPAER